jgi:GNAT superfamily N-acetyltransferase
LNVSHDEGVEPLPTRVWYLELESLRPSAARADVRRAEVPLGPLNRFFYEQVGREFHWVDRRGWDAPRWQGWAEQVETWLVYDRGTPAGYAELLPLGERVDLAYLGLLAPFRGRGLGGALLTKAVERALELAPRVTVNTCELDGPHALAAYRARGFRVAEERVEPRARSDLLQ